MTWAEVANLLWCQCSTGCEGRRKHSGAVPIPPPLRPLRKGEFGEPCGKLRLPVNVIGPRRPVVSHKSGSYDELGSSAPVAAWLEMERCCYRLRARSSRPGEPDPAAARPTLSHRPGLGRGSAQPTPSRGVGCRPPAGAPVAVALGRGPAGADGGRAATGL